jgi:hypothetical protein
MSSWKGCRKFPIGIVAAALVLASSAASQASNEAPRHLAVAVDLVNRIALDHTSYAHGEPAVTWDAPPRSDADCSGFVDELLKHTYGYTAADFKKWFDSHRPSAKRYHDAIVEGAGFTAIARLGDVRPGDFLAVKYLRRTDNTGHIMLVEAMPQRMAAKKPLVAGTEQWEVPVIDSSMTGHGVTDTRHKQGASGRDHDGLGRGVLRVYTDAAGAIVGFAWSTEAVSKFEEPDSEHLVAGRLLPGFKP